MMHFKIRIWGHFQRFKEIFLIIRYQTIQLTLTAFIH
jgi:hypothetical protein